MNSYNSGENPDTSNHR